jgi:peptidoglycan/LPS O-acetylase OafA/YrhL
MALFTTFSPVNLGNGLVGVAASFVPGRVVAAVVVLALIFGAGVYCAHDPAMKDWSVPLLHTFELLLGGLVGLLVGEKAGTPNPSPASNPPPRT